MNMSSKTELRAAATVSGSERGVCAIQLGYEPDTLARELQDRFPQATLIGGDAGLACIFHRSRAVQVLACFSEGLGRWCQESGGEVPRLVGERR
jgi:hypothetical protein